MNRGQQLAAALTLTGLISIVIAVYLTYGIGSALLVGGVLMSITGFMVAVLSN